MAKSKAPRQTKTLPKQPKKKFPIKTSFRLENGQLILYAVYRIDSSEDNPQFDYERLIINRLEQIRGKLYVELEDVMLDALGWTRDQIKIMKIKLTLISGTGTKPFDKINDLEGLPRENAFSEFEHCLDGDMIEVLLLVGVSTISNLETFRRILEKIKILITFDILSEIGEVKVEVVTQEQAFRIFNANYLAFTDFLPFLEKIQNGEEFNHSDFLEALVPVLRRYEGLENKNSIDKMFKQVTVRAEQSSVRAGSTIGGVYRWFDEVKFLIDFKVVPNAVARVGRLDNQEGYLEDSFYDAPPPPPPPPPPQPVQIAGGPKVEGLSYYLLTEIAITLFIDLNREATESDIKTAVQKKNPRDFEVNHTNIGNYLRYVGFTMSTAGLWTIDPTCIRHLNLKKNTFTPPLPVAPPPKLVRVKTQKPKVALLPSTSTASPSSAKSKPSSSITPSKRDATASFTVSNKSADGAKVKKSKKSS